MEYRRTFEWLQQENQALQEQIGIRHSMVGDSPADARSVQSDRSGIGDRQHRADPGREREREGIGVACDSLDGARASRPFVAVNCAALADSLSKVKCSDTRRAHSRER